MRTLQTLIDEAAIVCGSDRKLCERTGLFPSHLSDMRAGRLAMTPERVGLLADVLELDGDEARRLAVQAVVDAAKPARKEALRRAFFVCLALGAAVLCPDSNATNHEQTYRFAKTFSDSLYIVRSAKAGLRAWLLSLRAHLATSLQPQNNIRFSV